MCLLVRGEGMRSRWLRVAVACGLFRGCEIWIVGCGDGYVWWCESVMLLRKYAAAILGVVALIAFDVCGGVVVLVDV